MPYSAELVAKMRRMHFFDHYTLYAVSKAVGLHRDTVKRLLYQGREPPSCEAKASILDSYKDIIDEHLNRYPSIRATAMHKILAERGYKGSLSTLRRYLRLVRKKPKEGFVPRNYVPGEQAQVDWAHFGKLAVKGGDRKLYLFVMVLSYSRAIYAEFSFNIKTDSFLRLHERAFSYLGGVPQKILYDNLKSAVIERIGKDVKFNPDLEEFSGFYGFEPAACRPYAGNQKGRVERAIRYIRDNFASGYTVTDIEEANRDLLYWLNETANIRPWPQGREHRVEELWKEEKALLRSDDGTHDFHACYSKTIRSNKCSLIRFDLNEYSIPEKFNRTPLTLEADDFKVRLLHDKELVCEHQRSWSKDERIVKPEHWQRQVHSKKQQHRELILQIVPELAHNLRVLLERGETKHHVIRRFFELYHIYGDELFRQALRQAQSNEKFHPQQLSEILISIEKQGTRVLSPVNLPADHPHKNLHIESHSLDQYDLF